MSNLSNNPFSLQGKTLLINGAESGLGRFLAHACAERGATILQAVQPGRPIHGLVHCQDERLERTIEVLTESELTQTLQANLVQPVVLTQQLLQSAALAPKASIVFVLSTAAHIGARGLGAYAASKAGLLGMIKCLALEQAAHGIRVNGISPQDDEAAWPDVANAMVYLLSDASRWVTGTSLLVNGAGPVQ